MADNLGEVLGAGRIECVAEGLGHTIHCANRDAGCKEPIMRFYGVGMIEVLLPCPKCGRHTMIRCTNEGGLSVFLMPRKRRGAGGT